ncbi:MAG: hypothetical protein KDA72_02640 [Planctomycetales bacterium]|nr:hypothetical protein [Planctomycetales bacterium]
MRRKENPTRCNIFSGDDAGARGNLCRWLGLSERLDNKIVARVLKCWKHFGGFIYFHFLLNKITTGRHWRATHPASDKSG